MNRILYLIMVMSVCLTGSVHASRHFVENQDGPSQKLLRQALGKVNMKGLNEQQREAMRKASPMIDQIEEAYEEVGGGKTSYVAFVSKKIGSVVEYWNQLEMKHKVSLAVPVIGFAIAGGAYIIFTATQSSDIIEIIEILNITANVTQKIIS